MDKPEVLISLYSSIPVLFLGILQVLDTMRRTKSQSKVDSADASDKISSAYERLMDDLRVQVADLKVDVAYLKKELKKYTNWSARLMKQIIELGHVPVPPPDTGELM